MTNSLDNVLNDCYYVAMSIVKIAKLVGVSHKTVARVVNNEANVSPETALRVKKVMEEIGYVPKPKLLRRGPKRSSSKVFKTGNVAFLTSAEGVHVLGSSPIMLNVIQGVEEALASYGMSMVQGTINSNRQLPPIVTRGEVDGVIIWPDLGDVSDETLEVLKNYPIVYLMTGREDRIAGDRVLNDNGRIGTLAAKYLIEKGCRKLIQVDNVNVHKNRSTWIDRWYGLEEYSSDVEAERIVLNIPLNEILEMKLNNQNEVIELLKPAFEGEGLVGIFSTGDSMTALLYPLLGKMGIEIGKYVEFISCNNERSILAGLEPLPASIDICPEQIGRKAVEQLRHRAANPYDTCKYIIEVEPILIWDK